MVYVFLADGFEEVEALTPVDMLRRCEIEVITVGVGNQSVMGSHGIPVLANITDSQITLDDSVEMIVLPGGMPGTLNLEKNPNVQAAIDFCAENNKYIGAICAAPSILGHKGLLDGKEATCYTGFEEQLGNAKISHEPVCVDGKMITSRGAGTAMPFAFELVRVLTNDARVEKLINSVLY